MPLGAECKLLQGCEGSNQLRLTTYLHVRPLGAQLKLLESGVWCLSAWSRFHRTHRIRLPRPGWAGRRHTAVGEASIASLSSPPRSPPPPSPGSPLPSAGRHTARAGGGELAAYRLPKHCTVLGRWRAWVAELQARHALRCIRAISRCVE